jgi:hypothetical protein
MTALSGSKCHRCRAFLFRYCVGLKYRNNSANISRRRTMSQKSYQYSNRLPSVLSEWDSVRIVLFGFRKNRASYSARSPLIHSYGYESDKRSHRLISLISAEVQTLHEISGLANCDAPTNRNQHRIYAQRGQFVLYLGLTRPHSTGPGSGTRSIVNKHSNLLFFIT